MSQNGLNQESQTHSASVTETEPLESIKTKKKPSNLRKRKRELSEDDEHGPDTKRAADLSLLDDLAPSEYVQASCINNLEETRQLQLMRIRQRGSNMSSEHVLMSKAEPGLTDDSTIGSLNQNFTVQKERVDTLDKRMQEYIEQEMSKIREKRKVGWTDTSEAGSPTDAKEPEVDEIDEGKSKTDNKSKSETQQASSTSDPYKPLVIDLSDSVLRVTHASSPPANDNERKFHKSDGNRSAVGILEVDLPVEDQLRMIEKTRAAALKALEDEKKQRRIHQTKPSSDFFESLDVAAAGNMSVDFSKYKRTQSSAYGKSTDDQVYDKFRKKASQMYK